MDTPKFVLNTRTNRLHKFPTMENCNLDSVEYEDRKLFWQLVDAEDFSAKPIRFCKHCFKSE